MNETEIITEIRRLIREPNPVSVSNTEISAVISRGVMALGQIVKESAPSYHTKKAVLTSYTNVFALPSDCLTIRTVWDAGTTATAITEATNASPIQITSASHGLADDDFALVSGVLGNTAANGTWLLTLVDDDNVTLDGAEGNADYTSGGYIIEMRKNLTRMERIAPSKSTLTNRYSWFPQGNKIVVDYQDITNDLIIDYGYRPTEVTDIPVDYHDGIVAYGVIRLMRMPVAKDPLYGDKRKVLDEQIAVLNEVKENIRSVMQDSSEAEPIEDEMMWDTLWGSD